MTLIKLKNKSLTRHLIVVGLTLHLGTHFSHAEEILAPGEKIWISVEEKFQLHLTEIATETRTEESVKNGYYVERKSHGTGKETDPPKYVKQANETWLKDYDGFVDADWLDLGLEFRARQEIRDNDFRRDEQNVDEPLLLRTRAFLGVKNVLDPLRFAIEVQDSGRSFGDYSRQYDTRDVNQADILQAYAELNFKKTFLGKDALGNERPIWIRAGRNAWEAGDRRLIARNEWRNTTNTFEGLRSNVGDKKNDWQLELFAVKPVQRFTNSIDKADDSQHFYGSILNYRGWSNFVTFEPFYFLLKQDGSKVQFDANGKAATASAKINREIHTGGLRAYGQIPKSQWDFDASYVRQWGYQDRKNTNGVFQAELNHDAHAYNAEIGYTFKHPWKPRVSAFYAVASGDKNNDDNTGNQRFERLFGFARPWSNNDYIQMENIRTPKVRIEFDPKASYLDNVKIDTGFSWYRLDSAKDRWNAGANLQDKTGASGTDLGKEYDLRIRFPITQYASLNLGYAYFWAGDFVKSKSKQVNGQSNRDPNSQFLYTELSILAF